MILDILVNLVNHTDSKGRLTRNCFYNVHGRCMHQPFVDLYGTKCTSHENCIYSHYLPSEESPMSYMHYGLIQRDIDFLNSIDVL